MCEVISEYARLETIAKAWGVKIHTDKKPLNERHHGNSGMLLLHERVAPDRVDRYYIITSEVFARLFVLATTPKKVVYSKEDNVVTLKPKTP